MSSRRLPLTALRTFEAAARLLSFKSAAEELCVSQSTVSNQIRQLERDWGVLLIVRKTRHVALTDRGKSLARVLSRALEDIRTEIDAHIVKPMQTVTVAVGPIFGSRWLIPRLAHFRKQNANIELVLHHGPRITGAEGLQTSVGIDWGTGDWSGLEASHILDIVYAPVISPRLLRDRGMPSAPEDLLRLPIIHQHDRTEWRAWMKLAGIAEPKFAEETVIVDSNVVLQAAIDGQGVALGIFPFIQQEVDEGRLLRPFELELRPSRSYYLLTRSGAKGRPEVAVFCDWLLEEARTFTRLKDSNAPSG